MGDRCHLGGSSLCVCGGCCDVEVGLESGALSVSSSAVAMTFGTGFSQLSLSS